MQCHEAKQREQRGKRTKQKENVEKETKSSKWTGWHNRRQRREISIHELLRRQKSIPAIIVGILRQRAEMFVIQTTKNYRCKTASVQAGPSAQQHLGRCSAQSKLQHIKA